MAKFNRRQLLRTGLAVGALTTAATQVSARQTSQQESKNPDLRLAQAGTTAGYNRQMSGLLIRSCDLAVAQFLYSVDNPSYDGSLRTLPSYTAQFDRYTQVASFRAPQITLSDQDSSPAEIATKTAADATDVAIGIRDVFFGYALTSDTHHIIALRGTQTNSEWVNNVSSRQVNFQTRQPQYGRVHRGFQAAYEKVITQIRRAVEQLNPALPLYLSGHSLGGAVAILTAADLSLNNGFRGPMQVYTYGSPRVGDPTFAQFYNGLLPSTFRIVNLADTVPITPPEQFRGGTFQHVGQEWSYLAQLGNVDANHATSIYTTAVDRQVEVNQARNYPTSALCS